MEKLPQEPSPELIDQEINQLLEKLDTLRDRYSPAVEDKWWDVEMEARIGIDRLAAKKQLEDFIKFLETV